MATQSKTNKMSLDKKPKTTRTTTVSRRKTPQGEPRRVKTVEKTYSDYPLKRKNLLEKTTSVKKKNNTGSKTTEKNRTATSPTYSPDKTVVNSKKAVKDLSGMTGQSGSVTREKTVKRDNTGMFNPLAGSSRNNRTVIKKRYRSE